MNIVGELMGLELKEIEALLGEKDLLIYKLSKQHNELITVIIPSLLDKLREKGIDTSLNLDPVRIEFKKIKK